jgi:short-subunit dehydrogenase
LSESLYQDLQLVDAPIGASVLCPYFVPTGISQSHRNRPDELKNTDATVTASQRAAQAMSDKAVNSGKVSAADVAAMTFAAIDAGQFYIYSHPQALANVAQRMEEIVQIKNPSDPYAAVPHIRDMLREKLQAG